MISTMIEGFHHAALAASDIPSAVSFYREILELRPIGTDDSENTVETADYFWMEIGNDEWNEFRQSARRNT